MSEWRTLLSPALDLALDRLSDEVRALLLIGKQAVDARERPGRKPGRSLLIIYLGPSHGRRSKRYHFFCQAAHFVDITY